MLPCRTFKLNRERAVDYLNMLDRIYVFDGFAGWEPEVRHLRHPNNNVECQFSQDAGAYYCKVRASLGVGADPMCSLLFCAAIMVSFYSP